MNTEITQTTQELVPYLSAYGLTAPPFTADIRPDQYYTDEILDQSLNQLKHLVQSSPMVLVIVGAKGSGKTCLKNLFQQQAAENLLSCRVQAHTKMTDRDLLKQLATCLDIPPDVGPTAALALINDKIKSVQKHDRYPVLLLDDAQLLDASALDLILHLQQDENRDEPGWRIILFTEPSLMPELMQYKFRQHYIRLNPFTLSQTRQYLLHRLRTAGYQGDFPFTEEELEQILLTSGGIPGEINQAAHESLMQKISFPPTQPGIPETELPPERTRKILPWLLGTAIAVIVIVVFIFQEKINALFETGKKNGMVQEKLPLPVTPDYLVKQVPDSIPIERAKPFTPESAQDQMAKVPSEPPEIELPEKRIPVDEDIRKPGITGAKTSDTDADTGEQTPESVIKGLPEELKQHNWVLQQSPTAYTIQLAGAKKTDILVKLANTPELVQPSALYLVQRNRKDWYVLVYGVFSDRASAVKASRSLPDSLQRNQPWVRKFGDIQNEIRQGHK